MEEMMAWQMMDIPVMSMNLTEKQRLECKERAKRRFLFQYPHFQSESLRMDLNPIEKAMVVNTFTALYQDEQQKLLNK